MERTLGSRLEELSISLPVYGAEKGEEVRPNLKGYQKLKKLELQILWEVNKGRGPRLRDLLPASVEDVTVLLEGVENSHCWRSQVSDLFRGMSDESRKLELPLLEHVIVKYSIRYIFEASARSLERWTWSKAAKNSNGENLIRFEKM